MISPIFFICKKRGVKKESNKLKKVNIKKYDLNSLRDNIKDIPFGQGWNMVAQELQEVLREITLLGFGLILICHSKKKASSYTDEEGNPISAVEPDIGSKKIDELLTTSNIKNIVELFDIDKWCEV